MKVSCNKSVLSEAVINVSRAVAGKSSLPALEGILLKAKDNRLYLSGYDLETGIATSIEAVVLEEGDVILTARVLADIVKKASTERVEISCNEKLLTKITAGTAEFTILGIPSVEYPELPSYNEIGKFTIAQNVLKSMIQQTIYAISQNTTRVVHTGTLFEIQDSMLNLVSLDGFRLAVRSETIDEEEDSKFIVPGKTLTEISKLLSDEDDKNVSISFGRKHITFDLDDYKVSSRLLEGTFLEYRHSVPDEVNLSVRVNTREFIEGLERVSLLITEKLRGDLNCKFENDTILLSCDTTIGRATDVVNCKMEGEPVEMGFNSRYLIEALRYSECDEVKISIKSNKVSPVLMIKPIEGDSLLYLVLPLR